MHDNGDARRGDLLKRVKELVREWMPGEILICLLAVIWYDNAYAVLFLQLLLIPYGMFAGDRRRKLRKKQVEKGFYDFLQSFILSLQAGYSLENACLAGYRELRGTYGEKDAFVDQLRQVAQGIEVHIPVEELFHEMAQSTGNEDIHQFAVILEILKTMGGNSVEVMKNSVVRIRKKMETAEEIRTLLSGKIYEKNLMLLMPFFMVLYLRITNPSYLDTLYHTLAGQVVMTVSLAGILVCFFWGERIMRIAE